MSPPISYENVYLDGWPAMSPRRISRCGIVVDGHGPCVLVSGRATPGSRELVQARVKESNGKSVGRLFLSLAGSPVSSR